jgi:hypothetical protein
LFGHRSRPLRCPNISRDVIFVFFNLASGVITFFVFAIPLRLDALSECFFGVVAEILLLANSSLELSAPAGKNYARPTT